MTDLVKLIESAWPDLQISTGIGQGLDSRVYSAALKASESGEQCAVKAILVPGEYENQDELRGTKYSDEEIEQYLEARALSRMREIQYMQKLTGCGHIVHIEDHKMLHPEKFQYVVLLRMELLTPLIRRAAGGISSEEVAQIGVELCDALSYCHERRIVHRDIKPSNIFADKNGAYKLGDFSASTEYHYDERTLTVAGTPQFMAPELFKGSTHPDAFDSAVRTDIYSLGLVLYWLLNGCVLPFFPSDRIATYEEARAAFDRRMSGEALPAPAARNCNALLAVIRKATDYAPEKRYKSAAEMKEALQAAESQGAKLSRSLVKGTVMLMSALMVLALVAIILCATGIIKRPQAVLSEQPAQIETSGNKEPVLPEGLNLPLPDKEEFWNVMIFMPPFTGIWREGQSELWRAFDETAIEENWVASGVGENQTYRQCLENMLSSDFLLYRDGLRADIVIIIQQDEDLGDIIQRFTQAGMPVYQFSSTEPTAVHREWVALLEGSAE